MRQRPPAHILGMTLWDQLPSTDWTAQLSVSHFQKLQSPAQVLNLTTYPHLMGFLDALGVETEESEMSFSLSMDQGKLEWASHGLGTIFAQRGNLWRASFWRMIWDVIRFGRQAPQVTIDWRLR